MDGFERRKEQTKDRVRRAALDLFQRHGIKKVGLNEIAARAGVSPVTIYNRFGGREALVREVVESVVLDSVQTYRSIMESDASFTDKLGQILFQKTEIVSRYGADFIQAMTSADPQIQHFIQELFEQEVRPLFGAFLEQGRREGCVSPNLSDETVLAYIRMYRDFSLSRFEGASDSESNMRLLRELWTLFFYGLMGSGDETAGPATGREGAVDEH